MNDLGANAPFDFHVHTDQSVDGAGSIIEYCELALSQGLKAIGFSDHLDLDPNDVTFGAHDYERYCADIEQARSRFGDRLTIRMGIEVGFVPRIINEISETLNGRCYDYVIGSVHSIDDGHAGISDQYEALETFARHEYLDAYHEYFETVGQMVVSGLFDVVGHLDLVNRYGIKNFREPIEWGIFYGELRRIFEGAVKRQMAVEINASGLRQDPQSTYPPPSVLRLYHELDGEAVIIGSDAHRPEDLGAGVATAVKQAREARLTPISFNQRVPEDLSW